MVITAKSRRKMFRRRISKCFRDLCNLFLRIGKQNGSGRHTGFCLFLLEGFSIIFHQKTLRLSGTELQPVGEIRQGKILVFVQKIFLNDNRFGIRQIVGRENGTGNLQLFVITDHEDNELSQKKRNLFLETGITFG